MPYNYLLDMNTRMIMETKVSNAIVIFDEAHNIEGVAEDGVSFDMSSNTFADCETDVKILYDKQKLFPDDCKISPNNLSMLEGVVKNLSKNFGKWRLKLQDELRSGQGSKN